MATAVITEEMSKLSVDNNQQDSKEDYAFECHNCGDPTNTVYYCSLCEKSDELQQNSIEYCDDCKVCGKMSHKNNKKGHSWKNGCTKAKSGHSLNELVLFKTAGTNALMEAIQEYLYNLPRKTFNQAKEMAMKVNFYRENTLCTLNYANAKNRYDPDEPVLMTGLLVFEMAHFGIQLYRGKIDWNEFGRLMCKSIIQTTCLWGGAVGGGIGGFVVGGAIGSFAGPIGTGIGALVGYVIGYWCGVGGGLATGIGISKLVDKVWPKSKKNQQQQILAAAMKQYGINKEDINNPEKFNEKSLRNVYHGLAKVWHPDRNTGNETKFRELGVNLGLLLALLDQTNNGKKIDENVAKMIMAIEFNL